MISFCRIAGAYFFTEAGLITYGIIMRCCFVRNFLGVTIMKQFCLLSLRFWLFCQAVGAACLLILLLCGFSWLLLLAFGAEVLAYAILPAEALFCLYLVWKLGTGYWVKVFSSHDYTGSIFVEVR